VFTSKMTASVRTRLALGATAFAVAAIVPAGVAHAEWFYTKSGAEIMSKDYVSKHYADTYESDLTTACRPQGRRRADPAYKYHRWICGWYDSDDKMAGSVLIVGSRDRSGYYGSIVRGSHRVS
jgi:hypothetical protein